MAGGALSAGGALAVARTNPQVVASGATVYAYDAENGSLEAVRDGKEAVLEGAFPAFREGADDARSFAAVAGGVAMVGPLSADGKADTYLLIDGHDAFEPYAKRSSDAKALAPTAAAYDGRVYALGPSLARAERALLPRHRPRDRRRARRRRPARRRVRPTRRGPGHSRARSERHRHLLVVRLAGRARVVGTARGWPGPELSPFQAAYFAVMGDEERELSGMNPFMPDDPYRGGITPFKLAGSLAAGKGAVVAQEGVDDGPYDLDESLRFATTCA